MVYKNMCNLFLIYRWKRSISIKNIPSKNLLLSRVIDFSIIWIDKIAQICNKLYLVDFNHNFENFSLIFFKIEELMINMNILTLSTELSINFGFISLFFYFIIYILYSISFILSSNIFPWLKFLCPKSFI
jgi:hypothetical protein